MCHGLRLLGNLVKLPSERGGQVHQEGGCGNVEALAEQSHTPFELLDIIEDGGHHVVALERDIRVFLAAEPALDNLTSMAQSPSHVLDGGEKRGNDLLLSQGL